MNIKNIIPYEKNARDNSANIPKIAESIERFGFIGQIVLESKENPVIVAGHHRVKACEYLGWKEIPDENITYCEGLTDDEIKALRLADNRTHEGGKWNKALLKNEIKNLEAKSFDMGKLGFDFKSKFKGYGEERARTGGIFNLNLLGGFKFSGEYDMPELQPVDFKPSALLPFNYAKTAKGKKQTLHFFIDDYQFVRLWNHPEQYLGLLKEFEAVLTPDFSLYTNMPKAMQIYSLYMARFLGQYWQKNGIKVIPTLSWSTPDSYKFCFDGFPTGSTFATSTVGVKTDKKASKLWREGMAEAIKRVRPKRLIVYGSPIDFDFGTIEVVYFKPNTAFRKD